MLYLVTGGSGSGKSEYAEELAVRLYEKERRDGAFGRLVYAATMFPYDDGETRERIARHRRQRAGKGFLTVECFCGAERISAERGDVFLLDCMSNLLANEMYLEAGRITDRGEDAWAQAEEAIVKPLLALGEKAGLVVVTNEVFSDGAAYEEESMRYIALLGYLNRRLAEGAAQVTEVVCGIPLAHRRQTGGKPEARQASGKEEEKSCGRSS